MTIDNRAMKILKDYDVLNPENTSKEDFNYAKKAGVMFDEILVNHDKVVKSAIAEAKKVNKKGVTDLFLASLSSGILEWRIGLPAYAIMRVLPMHSFIDNHSYCKLCSVFRETEEDFNFTNQVRHTLGGICNGRLYDMSFILKQHNKLTIQEPIEKDLHIFIELLSIIKNADLVEKKNDILKKIKRINGLKSTNEQRRAILETLGYCSILETETRKGFLSGYTNLGQAERSKHSTDWAYPVDWWQVKDGINYEALKFWFGDYKEIEAWIEDSQ